MPKNILSIIWLRMAYLFMVSQPFFNGNFWQVLQKKLGKFTNQSIVDLACGTGDWRNYINPKQYLGLDINPAYIDLAKRRFQWNNTKFEVRNILNYQPEKSVDVVFLIGAAHHLSDAQLKKLFHNLKKAAIKKFILIDGFPIGWEARLLRWLDNLLGGGKYFREIKDLEKLAESELTILEKGILLADKSCYKYPYIIATSK